MKKTLSIIAILTILIFSASSCSKCTECNKSSGSAARLCRDDYSSNTTYNLAISSYENNGYICN